MIHSLNNYFKRSLIVGMTLSGLLLTSCSPLEVLPGLCYTDKDGTYLCRTEQSITRSANETKYSLDCNKYGLIEYCDGLTKQSMKCICVNHNDMSRVTDFLWR